MMELGDAADRWAARELPGKHGAKRTDQKGSTRSLDARGAGNLVVRLEIVGIAFGGGGTVMAERRLGRGDMGGAEGKEKAAMTAQETAGKETSNVSRGKGRPLREIKSSTMARARELDRGRRKA